MKTKYTAISLAILLWMLNVNGQHRGDNLAFQGLSLADESGVKAFAQGGAFTARTGDVNALHWNPAGLADIKKDQLSVSFNSYQKLWRENQTYRPNRFLLTLPFYLEGLYIPDPANNGEWDYEIFERERDSTYVVSYPVLGADPFGEKAADWQKKANDTALSNFAVAIPVDIAGTEFVLAAAYNRMYNVLDFDRNDTYLDPHIGYDEYGLAERVANDTLRMDWYRFLRERTGSIDNFSFGAAFQISKRFQVGFAFGTMSGETNDRQQLDKVGWFDLAANNRVSFSYDTLNTHISGTSKFSASNLKLGAIYNLNKLSVGLSVVAPYTFKRTWNYTIERADTSGTVQSARNGEDKMKVPLAYTLGVSFQPVESFVISLDVENKSFSKGSFELADGDSAHRDWVDQNIVRFGFEFRATEWLSLMAGYRNLPEVFVPDGAALKDRGPAADSYTMGFSARVPLGRLDLAYEIRRMKYYDSYYSNTNYVLETLSQFMVAYTVEF